MRSRFAGTCLVLCVVLARRAVRAKASVVILPGSRARFRAPVSPSRVECERRGSRLLLTKKSGAIEMIRKLNREIPTLFQEDGGENGHNKR